MRHYGTGVQGWYNPFGTQVEPADHTDYYQINIESIFEPFTQQAGEVYWLVFQASFDLSSQWGWKTSLNHFGAEPVYDLENNPIGWTPIGNPEGGGQLDMAFVITPAPGTGVALITLGALAGVRRRR